MTATIGQYYRCRVTVDASNRRLIRKAYRLLSAEGKTRAWRQARHAWLRSLINHHQEARKLASLFL